MTTFSPSYDSYSVLVNENKSDSMRTWIEPHIVTEPRTLNKVASLPFFGAVIGVYRIFTGCLDLIVGCYRQSAFQQKTGVKNIFYGALQIIPTAFSYKTFKDTPVYTLAVAVISATVMFFISRLDKSKLKTQAPVALFYDNVCVIELYPKANSSFYNFDEWVEQLKKYGTRVDKYNRFIN